jgi:hypothetical protein
VEIDVTHEELDQAERGHPVPGWYAAYVDDAFEDPKNPGTWVLKMPVAFGRWAGYPIVMRFPDLTTVSDEAAAVIKKKILIWAPRLELIPRGTTGRVSIDWRNAIGKELAIKLANRKYKDKDGNDKEAVEITFDGVYLRHDDRVPLEIRSPKPGGDGNNGTSGGAGTNAPVQPSSSGSSSTPTSPPSNTTLYDGHAHTPAPAGKIDYASL